MCDLGSCAVGDDASPTVLEFLYSEPTVYSYALDPLRAIYSDSKDSENMVDEKHCALLCLAHPSTLVPPMFALRSRVLLRPSTHSRCLSTTASNLAGITGPAPTRAIVYTEHGQPTDVLKTHRYELKELEKGEVRVRFELSAVSELILREKGEEEGALMAFWFGVRLVLDDGSIRSFRHQRNSGSIPFEACCEG